MAERCRQKRDVKLSIVFVTAFSDRFERFQRKSGVNLRVFGESEELN
jgi:hypothetical protein